MNFKTIFVTILTALFCTGLSFAQDLETKNKFIEKFDADGDGYVSIDEFKGPEHVFSSFDKDNDSYISSDEAPEKMGNGKRGEKNFIADFDKDGDDKVSKDEFPGPDDHFTMFDKDSDGYLSEDEAPKGPPPGKRGKRSRQ